MIRMSAGHGTLLVSSLLLIVMSSAPVQSQPTSGGCTAADIVFVLDSSGSIKLEYWSKVLSFVDYIVTALKVSYYETRVGVVTFGNEATINFNLNSYNTTQQVVDAVNKIPFKDENTNTSGALYVMRTVMFTPKNGDRANVRNMGIVVTDGMSTYDHDKTIPYAMDAKRAGIVLVVIGVGSEVNQTELEGIASTSPNGTHFVYNVSNYDALSTIQNEIAMVACRDVDVCEFKTPFGHISRLIN